MTDYTLVIPDEHYQLLEFTKADLPGVAVINCALKAFEPKVVFDWQLSIILDLEDLVENGMPSTSEQRIIDEYGDFLDDNIKRPEKQKPNALFLARITSNKTRQNMAGL